VRWPTSPPSSLLILSPLLYHGRRRKPFNSAAGPDREVSQLTGSMAVSCPLPVFPASDLQRPSLNPPMAPKIALLELSSAGARPQGNTLRYLSKTFCDARFDGYIRQLPLSVLVPPSESFRLLDFVVPPPEKESFTSTDVFVALRLPRVPVLFIPPLSHLSFPRVSSPT